MIGDLAREQAAELLAWYAEMGVDIALSEEPQDRFAESARVEAAPRPVPAAETRPSSRGERALPGIHDAAPSVVIPATPTRAQDDAVADARALARTAESLEQLRALLESYDGVALRKTATQLVFADGNPAAKLMFVGEAPGRDEDREGLPFVGRAGQLLDRMLAAIGLDRNDIYIANVVPWRPPGNRKPTLPETALCLPFIQRQIELVDPDVLVMLGGTPMAALLGKDGIMRLRGTWHDYDTGTRTIKALPTLHPAYLLRTPSQKKFAWRDFRALKAELESKR